MNLIQLKIFSSHVHPKENQYVSALIILILNIFLTKYTYLSAS